MKVYFNKTSGQVAMVSDGNIKAKVLTSIDYNLSEEDKNNISKGYQAYVKDGKLEFLKPMNETLAAEKEALLSKAKTGKATINDIINFLSKI